MYIAYIIMSSYKIEITFVQCTYAATVTISTRKGQMGFALGYQGVASYTHTVDLKKKLTFRLRSTIVVQWYYGKKVRIPMCNYTKRCLVVRS